MPATPNLFLSYSHKDKAQAIRLYDELVGLGAKVWRDEVEMRTGDSIIQRVGAAVMDADFVVALISEHSVKSEWCQKELSLAATYGLNRGRTSILPVRLGDVEMPAFLADLMYRSYDEADQAATAKILFDDALAHRGASASGPIPVSAGVASAQAPSGPDDPIKIVGVDRAGVTSPRSDGTRGSALYRVPLKLSRRPSSLWARHFEQTWDHPPRFTSMHRPGICRVVGDTVVLDGTTMDEIERYHAETLRHIIAKVNDDVVEPEAKQRRIEEQRGQAEAQHRREIDEISDRLDFGYSNDERADA